MTWNFQGGLKDKWGALASLKPDVAIIQEVREKELRDFGADHSTACPWIGDKGAKGLGVIGCNGWMIHRLPAKIRARHFLPFAASKGKKSIQAMAVWAMAAKSQKENSYIGQVYNALSELGPKLKTFQFVLGDFNANKIWDHKRVAKNFSAVAEKFKDLGFMSAYHAHHKQAFGAERHATFYLYRHKAKSYHIDYCFMNSALRRKLKVAKIGRHETWSRFSDHVPLVIEF